MNYLRINGYYRFVNNGVECEMFPKHSCNSKLIGHSGSIHVLINQKEPRKCLLHFEGHGGSVDGVWLAGKAKRHSIDLHQNASNQVASPSDLSCKQATTCRTSIHRARASQMHVIAGCDRVQPVRPFKWQALYSVFLPKNMCRFTAVSNQLFSSVAKCP